MKRIIPLVLGLLVIGLVAQGQIVNNSTSGITSEDSITVSVAALDSVGNPTSADSFYVVIFSGGNTNTAVFADSGIANGAGALVGLDTVVVGGVTFYYYSRVVSDIDGGGANGYYSGLLIAKNTTFSLSTVSRLSFQIVSTELSSGLANLDAAITSRSSHSTADVWNNVTRTITAVGVDGITPLSIQNGAINAAKFTTDVFIEMADSSANRLELLTVTPGARSVSIYGNDMDTVFIYDNQSVLVARMVYVHMGGTPGASPDTVRVIGP